MIFRTKKHYENGRRQDFIEYTLAMSLLDGSEYTVVYLRKMICVSIPNFFYAIKVYPIPLNQLKDTAGEVIYITKGYNECLTALIELTEGTKC